MKQIYDVVQENPEFFAWAFGVVNFLWILFTYFNNQSHDQKLVELEQRLRLDADRRLKVFELKVGQYEAYVSLLDEFGRRQQNEMQARMEEILAKYFVDYLNATGQSEQAENVVIAWLGDQVAALVRETHADSIKLKTETARLKLTATDEMVQTLSLLEVLTDESVATANSLFKGLVEAVRSQGKSQGHEHAIRLGQLGKQIQQTSANLLNQMRAELRQI